ncbi:MAG: hypothetical protein WA971_08205 [Microbacterium sp.]
MPEVPQRPRGSRAEHLDTPFRSVEALSDTFEALGFALRRHVDWTDGTDTVLIAELAPARL